MRKLIVGPLLILAIPQLVIGAFFLLASAVLGDSMFLRGSYVIVAALVLLGCGITSAVNLSDNWLPEYNREQQRLRERREREREELRKRIDAEVGIPRIGGRS